jgi:predicted metal-dependent hydrolase
VVTGHEAARLADQLLRAGRPFHAHEVLEASWKHGPPQERDLWQGLAQVAVGLTHAHRGNARGAVVLLRGGSQRVRAYQPAATHQPSATDLATATHQADAHQHATHQHATDQVAANPYGMDIAAFLNAAEGLAARIERHGLAGVPPADLSPGLLSPGDEHDP